MNTVILEQASRLEEVRSDLFGKLLENRILFIDDLYSDAVAADIIAVLFLLGKNPEDKITLFISAESGDLRNVFAIYDAIKIAKSTIETVCIGAASREAALLLSAGTKGHRFITKNSDVCLSSINYSFMDHSDLTNIKISHDKVLLDNESFLKELSKNIGKSLKVLKKDTERQLYLTSAQAVKYGLADKVVQ